MTAQLESVKKILEAEGLTCAVSRAGRLSTSHERGIKPLLDLLRSDPDALRGALLADKVIGKAAALLMVYGGVAEVYSGIVSEHALAVFERAGVPCTYAQRVDYIQNRAQSGMCPMEERCIRDGIESPEDAWRVFDCVVPR